MRWAEIVFVVGLAAFAASLAIGSLDLKYSGQYSFGPGFVPLNGAIIVLVCCALQLWRILRTKSPEAKAVFEKGAAGGAEGDEAPPNLLGLAITALIIVAGVAAMSLGSVLLPLVVMVFLVSWGVSRHSPLISVFVSLATVATIYLVFSVWLGLPVV